MNKEKEKPRRVLLDFSLFLQLITPRLVDMATRRQTGVRDL
jgi:hypothetical protein